MIITYRYYLLITLRISQGWIKYKLIRIINRQMFTKPIYKYQLTIFISKYFIVDLMKQKNLGSFIKNLCR